MATKSFKIGEYAIGGIIKVDIGNTTITIKALDYNTKAEVMSNHYPNYDNPYWEMHEFLHELTSSYYADKILEYITENSNVNRQLFR
jgi:hypothetical protein